MGERADRVGRPQREPVHASGVLSGVLRCGDATETVPSHGPVLHLGVSVHDVLRRAGCQKREVERLLDDDDEDASPAHLAENRQVGPRIDARAGLEDERPIGRRPDRRDENARRRVGDAQALARVRGGHGRGRRRERPEPDERTENDHRDQDAGDPAEDDGPPPWTPLPSAVSALVALDALAALAPADDEQHDSDETGYGESGDVRRMCGEQGVAVEQEQHERDDQPHDPHHGGEADPGAHARRAARAVLRP